MLQLTNSKISYVKIIKIIPKYLTYFIELYYQVYYIGSNLLTLYNINISALFPPIVFISRRSESIKFDRFFISDLLAATCELITDEDVLCV